MPATLRRNRRAPTPTATRSPGPSGEGRGGARSLCRHREARDLYLLASDGLTGMVGDHDLAERLSRDRNRTPQDLVDDLIGEANRRGGVDNITAIVVRIESVHAPPGVSGPPRRVC